MKTAHIINIGHQRFAIQSTAAVVKILDLMSKAIPVGFHYRDSEGTDAAHYYPTEERCVISVEMSQPYRAKSKALALPRPKRGTRRCLCGHSDVSPGEDCPSCGVDYSQSFPA